MYIKHPILRLREEFMIYEDEAQTHPLLRVKSKQVIAINFAYEITDASSGRVFGTVRRQGLKSIVRDKFILLDPAENEIGYAEEQRVGAAAVLSVADVEARDLREWRPGGVHPAEVPILHERVHG